MQIVSSQLVVLYFLIHPFNRSFYRQLIAKLFKHVHLKPHYEIEKPIRMNKTFIL